MARWQYQQKAEPLTTMTPEVSWLPQMPDFLRAAPRPTEGRESWTPTPEHTIAADARAIYPDWLAHRDVRAADQSFFVPAPQPEQLAAWAVYPDYLWRITLPTGAIPWLALSPQPEQAAPHSFGAIYPDRIDRSSLPVAAIPAWVSSPQPEHVQALDARAFFDDLVWRIVLPTGAVPWLTMPPQPEQIEPQAFEAIYPDWIARAVLPTAAVPTWTTSPAPEQPLTRAASAVYPDAVWRPWLLAAAQQALALHFSAFALGHQGWQGTFADRVPATPRPAELPAWHGPVTTPAAAAVPDLAWLSQYPAFVLRVTLLPGHLLVVGVQPIAPIPGLGPGKDVIHLGTKESLGVTPDPTLGGWQAW